MRHATWCTLALALACGVRAAAGAEPGRDEALRKAEEHAAKIEDRFVRAWARYAVAEEWAHTDPARAADLADKLESWTARRDLLSILMFNWGRRDPKAAAAWGIAFKERTPGNLDTKNTALHYAVVGMVQKEPKLADELIWKHLQEDGWGNVPRTAPMEAARELAVVDPPAALALAEKITTHEGCRVDALRAVLREWAKRDPKAAGAALAGHKEKEFVKAFPRDLAEGWAHKDPKAAAEYAKTIPDTHTKILALSAVARETAKHDPGAAAHLCSLFATLNVGQRHEQGARLGQVVREVAEALARKDLQAATRWAQALPDKPGGCQANAFDGVAIAWAASEPRAALDYYAKAAGTGAALPALARALAKSDAQAALDLVEKAKTLVLKSHIIHDAAVEWAGADPPAAARLVASWAGVTDYYTYRTGAAAAVAAAWAAKDARAAAAWAAKLDPVRDRLAALRAVAAAWVRSSPAQARAWAESVADPQEATHAWVGLAEGLRGAR